MFDKIKLKKVRKRKLDKNKKRKKEKLNDQISIVKESITKGKVFGRE